MKVGQPCVGLIRDVKPRGLFGEMIAIWSGEFGRLPAARATTVAATIGTPSASAPGGFCAGFVYEAIAAKVVRAVLQDRPAPS